MSLLRTFRLRLFIGLVAMAVTVIASPFGGRMLGEFPLWVIAWISSIVSYITLVGPITGIAQAAEEMNEKIAQAAEEMNEKIAQAAEEMNEKEEKP